MLFAALRRAWSQQTQGAIVHMAGTVLSTLYLGGLVKHVANTERGWVATMLQLPAQSDGNDYEASFRLGRESFERKLKLEEGITLARHFRGHRIVAGHHHGDARNA